MNKHHILCARKIGEFADLAIGTDKGPYIKFMVVESSCRTYIHSAIPFCQKDYRELFEKWAADNLESKYQFRHSYIVFETMEDAVLAYLAFR